MSETEDLLNEGQPKDTSKYTRLFWFVVILAIAIFLMVRYISIFGNVLVVVIGFGAVVIVHEFGHFIVAKLSGIKVEAFSIGFPPVLAGIQRVENGWRIRILPEIFKKEGEEHGQFGFTIPAKCKAGETEYRIGLVPIGGFVKMLGQEDVGTAKSTDDPRSYANKPVSTRMAVITAGVAFNVISAILIFIIVFLVGIELSPPVIGSIVPGSPAERAGLMAGDEIIEIAGKKRNLDFSDIKFKAALSNKNEEVTMKVRHEDGSVGEYALVSEQSPEMPMKGFGIVMAQTLTIAEVSDVNALVAGTGLRPADKIVAAEGKSVERYWQMEQIVHSTFAPEVRLEAERTDKVSHKVARIETRIPLNLSAAKNQSAEKYDLSQICSIVPRLRIAEVSSPQEGYFQRFPQWLEQRITGGSGEQANSGVSKLKSGDIVLAAGDVENPTYRELREITTKYENKELTLKVLRSEADGTEKTVAVTVVPRRLRKEGRVLIGIIPALDAAHPVVAETVNAEGGVAALAIPRGATITAVNGVPVSNFYDIVQEIKQNAGRRITISYRVDEQKKGEVSVDTAVTDLITVESIFAKPVFFEGLMRLYRATGPVEAVEMGYNKTIIFVAQTYVTLKRLVSGLVSPKELMGPVGIVTLSYQIVAEQPLIYYVYFLGLISACIAVFNFLPFLPLDGGHIVLLTIEKIRGSALSERMIGMIAYAGWVLIGSFFLYITFNDIVRSVFQ